MARRPLPTMVVSLRKTLLAAAVALAALAPPAWAGTVSESGLALSYSAAPGEANRVTLTVGATGVTVVDASGAPVTPGAGCSAVTPATATCAVTGITAMSV